LGPPGAGKGTQAKRISAAYDILHLSTGEMLRAVAATDTVTGKRTRQAMASGKLVPDQDVIAAVFQRISQPDALRGFVLDGFPRTVSQAVVFDDLLDREGGEIDHAIELRADESVLLDRITTRASEAREQGCAVREDDTSEAQKVRLREYSEQTAPLIDYYRSRNILRTIDGLQSIDAVTTELFRMIECGSWAS